MAEVPALLKVFELGAWERYNPPSGSLPSDLEQLINVAWSRLPQNDQTGLTGSLSDFIKQRSNLTMAENLFDGTGNYPRSDNDGDTYGRETRKPEFDEYVECAHNLLAALRIFETSIQNLQQSRAKLGLPSNDCGEKYLDQMLRDYQEQASTAESVIHSLPQKRQAAREKLAARKESSERARIAEGRLGPLWEGKWPLGNGSFATASLFVKQGPGGRIVDHCVIKDSSYDSRPSLWAAKELWTDWKGPNDSSSIPNEVQAMYNLSGKIGSESIVEIRSWRIRRAAMFHRIYMEFCHQGDLYWFVTGTETVNSPYIQGAVVREMNKDANVAGRVKLVPEPFIWSAFWSLATAGLLMERGKLDASEGPSDPWDVIVHRDLKLGNVLLGWNNTERFRGFPSLKVADFGLATMLPEHNDKVSTDYQSLGTRGNRAPEQLQHSPKMMSSKTNVWATGIVMWSLITCNEGLLDPPFLDWDGVGDQEVPPLDATAREYYSDELLGLIASCLRYDDEERPIGDQLMYQINQFTGDGPFDFADGLRDAPLGDPRWDQHKLLFTKISTWYPGMLLEDVPPPGGALYGDAPSTDRSDLAEDWGGPAGAELVELYTPAAPAQGGRRLRSATSDARNLSRAYSPSSSRSS